MSRTGESHTFSRLSLKAAMSMPDVHLNAGVNLLAGASGPVSYAKDGPMDGESPVLKQSSGTTPSDLTLLGGEAERCEDDTALTQFDLALQRRQREGAKDVTAAVARFGSAW
jgi:hypothetical protein